MYYYPYQAHPVYYVPNFHPYYHMHPSNNHYQPQAYTRKKQQAQTEHDPSYPEVDASLFFESASAFKKLIKDASHILDKLSESKEFASKVMEAAQENNDDKVKRLIESTGVKGFVDIDYNPDGINLKMKSKVEGTDCCKLTMALRWR